MRRKEMRFGHFALDSVIGYGELGMVYRAKDRETGEDVALKILRPHHAGQSSAEELFLRGPIVASQIRHLNVVGIREIGTADGKLYYAMEYIAGHPLTQSLHREGLPLDARLRIVARVAHAVNHLHRCGVVHGDLKPSNILLTSGGEPKLTDFESAILRAHASDAGQASILRSATLCGTPPYMAPEVLRGDDFAFDPRRDVYALGVIAYRMVTGVMPYAAHDLMTLVTKKEQEPPAMELWDAKVPPRLEATIRRALMPSVEDRWRSAEEFASGVEGYLKGARPVPAREETEAPAREPLSLRQAVRKAACL